MEAVFGAMIESKTSVDGLEECFLDVSIDLSGIVFVAALVLGPALIAGGFVMYRQASAAGWRAFGMGSIAGGVGLLLFLALFLPATTTSSSETISVTGGPVVETGRR